MALVSSAGSRPNKALSVSCSNKPSCSTAAEALANQLDPVLCGTMNPRMRLS